MKNKALNALALALFADLTFILLHRFYLRDLLGEEFSVESDKGYAEIYQRLKELVIFVMIAALWLKRRDHLYTVWAVIFTYLFLDDTFQIHETVGQFLGEGLRFTPVANLRAQDYGEILVHAIVGSCFVGALAIGYRHGATEARRTSAVLLTLLVAFAFFGGVVDTMHAAFVQHWWGYRLGVIEDGGEMLVMSVILCFVISELMRATIPPARWKASSSRPSSQAVHWRGISNESPSLLTVGEEELQY